MIIYEKAGHQRLLAPMVEMYQVQDVEKLERGLDALRYSIENHDHSRLQKFYDANIEEFRFECRKRIWAIKSEHFRAFIADSRRSIQFFETEKREELLIEIESKYLDGINEVYVPAGLYELCLGGLRQVYRVTKFPGELSENQFFYEHYNDWFDGALADLAKGSSKEPERFEEAFDPLERYQEPLGYMLDGKEIEAYKIPKLNEEQIKELRVVWQPSSDSDYTLDEYFWWFSRNQFPYSWSNGVVALAVGPLHRSFGPSYYTQPPIGDSIFPHSWKPDELLCHEYPKVAGKRWYRIRYREINKLISWAESSKPTSPSWWPDWCQDDYQWQSKWEEEWPEVHENLVQGCKNAQQNQSDVLWRIFCPEELDL